LFSSHVPLPPPATLSPYTTLFRSQELWRQRMNNTDCIGCHQLGQESTRTIPAQFGQFKSGVEAWGRRIGSGQTGESMMNRLAVQDRKSTRLNSSHQIISYAVFCLK